MNRISVVINTLNEEKNLRYALASVSSWVDDIVVVDMQSEDRTVQIAQEYGARVFSHERLGFADPARAFAIEQATGDWILMLDADEVVPLELSRLLLDIVRTDKADVVILPWYNFLLGAPLLHTGWGPDQDRHPRFFKRGMLQATPEIHNFLKPKPEARIMQIRFGEGGGVYHFNYLNVQHFLTKLNRYTTIEAQQAFDQGKRHSFVRALGHSALEFCNRYFRKRGFLDGWRGFYLSVLMMMYRLVSYAKLRELEEIGTEEQVRERYREVALELIQQYDTVQQMQSETALPRNREQE
ncbi:glycosyltransferase involved in cell wall biosynthesis [Deinobacterium chartae]|uniref:Glycosyltransferase involved in cell wall biosynthesis n=1 Tax=Deinobacterium chartae TaxID=521158 RepID=A0A841HVS1_9DEIO|nr:glycosyltransferase family 2 protein [Deinobacterium chartae]MBB6097611.1 glycosyltransferase involved in cell wall biosynthesis [Deinobacterium chartae]